jgi:hypothetical protein
MASENGHGGSDGAVLTAHGAAAKCLARVIAMSIDTCEEANIPLSELQKVTLIEAGLLEFDGFGFQLAALVAVGDLLRDLGHL